MSFSKREGYKPANAHQFEEISTELNNAIFNAIYSIVKKFISPGSTSYGDTTYRGENAEFLWSSFFDKRTKSLPYAGDFLEKFECLYDSLEWFRIYDLIEFVASLSNIPSGFISKINKILEKYSSPYRLINNMVQPISSIETINMIDSAMKNSPTKEATQHLEKAQKLYSKKEEPDFNYSCLESIKAIESCLRSIFKNNDILSENIKKIKKTSYNQHIVSIIKNISVFRGDVIAHADKPGSYLPTREDAILIHSICCSFINFFRSKTPH